MTNTMKMSAGHLQRPERQRHHLAHEEQQRGDDQQDPQPAPARLVVRGGHARDEA